MDPHLHIISRDPTFRPEARQLDQLFALLRDEEVLFEEAGGWRSGRCFAKLAEVRGPLLLGNRERFVNSFPVAVKVHAQAEYFFPAQARFRANCSRCARPLPLPVWQAAMAAWERSGKRERGLTCPACSETQDLNELDYACARGFSRFSLDVAGLHEGNCSVQWTFLERMEDRLGTSLNAVLDGVDRGSPDRPAKAGRRVKGKRKKRR